MHRAGPAVLAAAVLYRAASGFLFVPLMQQVWSLTLRFAPMHYLNNSNASEIFTSPAIVGCIAAIAVLTAFWALYGFSILLHGLDRARRGETLRLLPLLGDSLRDIAHAWLPQNWLILIYSALLIPFTSFFLASDYITQLAVPEYILGVIRANARYHALYLAGALVLLALWVGGALVLPLEPFGGRRRSAAAAGSGRAAVWDHPCGGAGEHAGHVRHVPGCTGGGAALL